MPAHLKANNEILFWRMPGRVDSFYYKSLCQPHPSKSEVLKSLYRSLVTGKKSLLHLFSTKL
jgi:hypothetical protein